MLKHTVSFAYNPEAKRRGHLLKCFPSRTDKGDEST
jgi:hypothetical protein